jgi:metal-responsive CopG/Arc/MetJ family transcriptional regulator
MAKHKKAPERKKGGPTMTRGGSPTKRVVVQFPVSLYEEARNAMRELHTNQADLIRSAVEYFLEERKQRKLEEALAEGYIANAELGNRINEEFAFADSETP